MAAVLLYAGWQHVGCFLRPSAQFAAAVWLLAAAVWCVALVAVRRSDRICRCLCRLVCCCVCMQASGYDAVVVCCTLMLRVVLL